MAKNPFGRAHYDGVVGADVCCGGDAIRLEMGDGYMGGMMEGFAARDHEAKLAPDPTIPQANPNFFVTIPYSPKDPEPGK